MIADEEECMQSKQQRTGPRMQSQSGGGEKAVCGEQALEPQNTPPSTPSIYGRPRQGKEFPLAAPWHADSEGGARP